MSHEMIFRVNRATRIPIVVSMVLLVAAQALGAAKPEKVVVTRTVTGQPRLSRTFTGRKKNSGSVVPCETVSGNFALPRTFHKASASAFAT